MPNGQSLWSYGLLAYFFMELCFRLNLSLLLQKKNESGSPLYTRQMATLLAVREIPTSTFLAQTVALFCLLVPVPLARIQLNDSSSEQAIFGILAGIILAILYHSLYMKLFKTESPSETSRAVKLRCCLARIAMCLEGSLAMCCCCCKEPQAGLLQDDGTQLPVIESHGGQERRDRDVEAPASADSPDYRLPRLDPNFLESSSDTAAGSTAWRCCKCIQDFRGFFEFLFVDVGAEVQVINQRALDAELVAQQAESHAKDAEERKVTAEKDAEKSVILADQAKQDMEAAKRLKEEADRQAQEAQDAAKAFKAEEARARKDLKVHKDKAAKEMGLINHRASQVKTCIEELEEAKQSGEMSSLETAVNATSYTVEEMNHSLADAGEAAKVVVPLMQIIVNKQAECKAVESEWRRSLDNLKARVKQAKETPGMLDAEASKSQAGAAHVRKLTSDAESVFRCLMDAVRAGINVPKSDSETVRHAEEILTKWQRVFNCSAKQRELIQAIIVNVVWAKDRDSDPKMPFRDRYGDLTFTELCFCLQTVQKSESPTFVAEGLKLVQSKYPKDLQGALEYLNTLVFLLDYTEREDIEKAKELFRTSESNATGPEFLKKLIGTLCEAGNEAKEGKYVEDEAFIKKADLQLAKANPAEILGQIKQRGMEKKLLAKFRDIFVNLAEEQQKQYGVLMAPHHTQAIALLIFRDFLRLLTEQSPDLNSIKALIARVATGEGKSMLIAAQAAFVALSESQGGAGKKVHVIGTDERLVSRDFKSFEKSLFEKMGIKAMCLCRDSKEADGDTWKNVWDYDVVYCLPHHVSLLYTQEVTSGGSRLDNFKNCVLLIDEVDALVIDKSPTDLVIDNHARLSKYAMNIAETLHLGQGMPEDLLPKRGEASYEEKQRVYKIVQQRWKQAKEIKRMVEAGSATDFLRSADFADAGWVAKDPKSGLPDKSKQSTQLEILRFAHRLQSSPDPNTVKDQFPMKWFEPVFVMSKPLVFGSYSCILGFSGTLGNDEEKKFLQDAYKCAFLDVPEFLRTCSGDAFHTTKWTTPDLKRPENATKGDFPQHGIEVHPSVQAQLSSVSGLAIRARRHVPVLIIAGSTDQAKMVLDDLREQARKNCLQDWDVVRDLSFAQWERSKMDYKDNLFLSTQRVGLQATDPWRITVTDGSGGRGTDYKIFDSEADKLGGLLLIVMRVPLSSREWTQYQGRTARQDRRGQMCAVLCSQDYSDRAENSGRALPDIAYAGQSWVAPEAEDVAEQIMAFGTQYSQKALRESQCELVAGWRAHELCEVACKLDGGLPREDNNFLKWIKGYRFSTLADFEADAKKHFLGGKEIPKCALPENYITPYVPLVRPDQGRGVVFALDISGSMSLCTEQVKPEGDGKLTRLDVCKGHATKLLNRDVEDEDMMGLVLFDNQTYWKEPVSVGAGRAEIQSAIEKAKTGGRTALRLAISEGAKKLTNISEKQKWQASRSVLIVLTDGSDSNDTNMTVDKLALELEQFSGTMLLITVGLTSGEMRTFEGDFVKWNKALGGGDRARHFKADWEDVDAAFEKVREVLEEEVAGLDLSAA
eukprot:TRINITY_DN602_c0_g1_i1.p1 TRINITY_DN602_c0_g1~~TRINITY_DN602_c0_g1_i1.p1  ORF type:complete len:1742 (+),score=362.01 TRINITY_DN602_c0_g1_i1:541-5226(+)